MQVIRTAVTLQALLFAAGCLDASPYLEESRSPIVRGEFSPEGADPAVVYFYLGQGKGGCTGTLISPHVVLTAKHCTAEATPGGSAVFFGNDPEGSGIGTWIDVDEFHDHALADLALLKLAEPGPTAPIPVGTRPMADELLNEPVRIVGFGVTGEYERDPGIKRFGSTVLDSYDDWWVYLDGPGSKSCYGDSGGPYFIKYEGVEHVFGVVSFGTSLCEIGKSVGVRTDILADWIQEYVGQTDTGTCAGDGVCATGCTSPDPDCPCSSDGFCTSGCPNYATEDPDCTGCGTGDSCRQDCPVYDLDCCGADGSCETACPDGTDPDCEDTPTRPDAGTTSPPNQPDAGTTPPPNQPDAGSPTNPPGGGGGNNFDDGVQGGCAINPGTSGGGAPLAMLTGLLLTLTWRRRRRQ